ATNTANTIARSRPLVTRDGNFVPDRIHAMMLRLVPHLADTFRRISDGKVSMAVYFRCVRVRGIFLSPHSCSGQVAAPQRHLHSLRRPGMEGCRLSRLR